MRRMGFFILASVCTALVLVSAGREPKATSDKSSAVDLVTTAESGGGEIRPAALRQPESSVDRESAGTASAPLYNLNWYSVNGGGATKVTGTNFNLGLSVGQSAAGYVTGTNFKLGVGFWYGAGGACPITLSGDVNTNGTITSSDIIVLVNYVFKGGVAPMPCAANGDVNCNGSVTSADIIVLVNYVFKGGAPPCNTCTSSLAAGC
jgi:hypothetical protein